MRPSQLELRLGTFALMTSYVPNQHDYRAWREKRGRQLRANCEHHPLSWNKLISVVIDLPPAANSKAVQKTLDSLLGQDWNNLECTVFCGGQPVSLDTDRFFTLRGIKAEENETLSDFFHNGPAAYDLRGDYVVVVTAGATFHPSAFSTLNREIVGSSGLVEPELVLFDYEFCDEADDNLAYPALLPGFDPDFLACRDYIGSGVLIRADLFEASPKRPQTLRDILRAAAEAKPNLAWRHIRDVLMSLPGQPPVPEPQTASLPTPSIASGNGISVIIPNKNRPELLEQCLASIVKEREVSEIVIVDNASDSPQLHDLYEFYRREHGAIVVPMDQPFNFSRMINLGVQASSSDMLLLLNNDVQFRKQGEVGKAMAVAAQAGVGIAGARLLYPDFTIQHAGVLLNYNPYDDHVHAMHVGRGADCSSSGYLGQYASPRNYQAVTGAFMMTRRAVFDEVGGLDEVALPVEFNDIDFSLRVRQAGYKVLCLPLEGVIHHESVSRGKSNTPAVLSMRSAAQDLMARRWLNQFQNDPYRHPVANVGERAEVLYNFSGNFVG